MVHATVTVDKHQEPGSRSSPDQMPAPQVQFGWYNFIETGSIDRPDTPVRVKISIEDARDMNYSYNN